MTGGEGEGLEVDSALPPGGTRLEQASGGLSPETFDRLVIDHQRRIHRILLTLLGDADAADTLTQECFLRAFEKRDGFRGEARIGTWLVRIALNLARDHMRSRRVAFWRHVRWNGRSGQAITAAELAPHPGPSADRVMIAREQLGQVHAAVARLSHRQRACFVLRFVEVMTLEEIAAAMHLKVGTVKAHLSRAVGSVRKQLKAWDETCGNT